QERLQSIVGFTVNLPWVRRVYFSEILSQLDPIVNRRSRLDLAVIDDEGRLVWGHEHAIGGLSRKFPLLFLDPSSSMVAMAPDTAQIWAAHARVASRCRARGDALRFRVVGDARAENAAGQYPRDGRHARPAPNGGREDSDVCRV